MLPQSLMEPVRGLLSVCAAVAAMELLVGDGASAQAFRGLCALAVAVCAVRAALRLFC